MAWYNVKVITAPDSKGKAVVSALYQPPDHWKEKDCIVQFEVWVEEGGYRTPTAWKTTYHVKKIYIGVRDMFDPAIFREINNALNGVDEE